MKSRRGFCIIFLAVIYCWMVLTFAGTYRKGQIRFAETDVAKEYPFTNESGGRASVSILERGLNVIAYVQEKVDHMLKMNNPCYYEVLVLKRWLDFHILGFDLNSSANGKHEDGVVGDIVVKHKNGELAYLVDDKDISASIRAVSDFGKAMEEEGRNFLYFESPYKSGELADPYQDIYQDYADKKIEQILSELRAEGLDVLSMTEAIEKEQIDRNTSFFRTDHHWLPQTGLWGCRHLCEWLNNECGYDIDISLFDEASYSIQDGAVMIGSQGKKATEVYCETEGLPLVLPKYDSKLEVFNSASDQTVRGTIEETLFDWSVLDAKNLYAEDKYFFYGYGDQKLIQIHNLQKEDGRRLLILKYSFADCMVPYLSNAAEYVDVIAPKLFDGSLRTYINQTNPDTVVVIYGVASFVENLNFD